jgi:hypothetical protein
MGRGERSWGKSRHRSGTWPFVKFLLLVGTVLPLLVFVWNRQPPVAGYSSRTNAPLSSVTSSNERDVRLLGELGNRQMFPYSVIPGGVGNAQELLSALQNDPVAARHYAGFNVAKAHVIRLDRNEALYVSYRLGDRIYWTSRRLALRKGEAVLTDGEHEARTRCGNRISDTPESPVSSRQPGPAAFESPLPDLIQTDLPYLVPAANDSTPETAELLPLDTPPPTGWFFLPPIVPVWGTGRTPTTPITPAGPPPVRAPEPASLLLLMSGMSALAFVRRKRSR